MKIVLPEIGEDINAASVSLWHFNKGEKVNEGDDLVEMVTDKATFNIPVPVSGILTEIIAEEGETVKVGETIATIEAEGE